MWEPVVTQSGRIDPLAGPEVFSPDGIYFDTPTYGLGPDASIRAVLGAVDDWRAGTASMEVYDAAVARARELFARIVDAPVETVGIGAQVSALVGPLAAALPDGAEVVAPEGDFTSLLFPILANEWRGVSLHTVPLGELAQAVGPKTHTVAFSLVQSSSGEVADVAAVQAAASEFGVRTLVDATHAAGWYPFSAADFDLVVVAAYKWLLCPRGVAFVTVREPRSVPSLNAGWYSGEDPWTSIYGTPLRLADSARRFDLSPAWMSWMGAVPSLELIASLGVDRIHSHDLALADRLRAGAGLPTSPSAIVRLNGVDADVLKAAGITAATRASSVRVGCHLYNSSDDVDALIDVLGR
ncbi:MAG TPA: aminotransferase class V-fold PLP-dependent enzyme [Acidimicrobiia bacterium]|nr:aminotransferase class V-fold PLP-dependent enzyme [Acidimicrobiia bacterium]